MKKVLEKILNETNWEPFLLIVGVAVTATSAILPVVMAVSNQNGWWLLLWLATGTVCGLYWAVVTSFRDGLYVSIDDFPSGDGPHNTSRKERQK